MVKNLKAKFDENANIQTIIYSDIAFWISNGDDFFRWLDTWQELQAEYRKLMRGRV